MLLTATFLMLFYSGCSTRRLLYAIGETFIVHELDDTLELLPPQKDFLKQHLHAQFAWHRKEELPVYAQRLDELRQRFADGLSTDDVRWTRATFEELFGRLARHLAPDAGEFLATLEPSQVDHLERDIMKQRKKRSDALDLPAEDYYVKRSGELKKTLVKWIGPLEPSQKASIDAFVRHNREDALIRRTVDQRHGQEFLTTLRGHLAAASITERILARVTRDETDLSADEKAATDRLQAEMERLALAIDQDATPTQRKHLDAELASLHEDLVALSQ